MTAQFQTEKMTPEEYLAWEEQQPMKYEYLNGKVYGMTRETLAHNDIALNLASALKSHLQGKSCKVQTADTKVGVSTNGAFFYPDVVVSCDPPDQESRNIIYYPCLIVEVLSSSTEAFDRGKKFEHYRQIKSLQEYVLIDSEKISIEYYQLNEKNKWELTTYSLEEIADSQQEFSVKLESINFEFTTSLLYENVVFPEKINLEKDRRENPKQQDFSSAEDIQSPNQETPEKQTRLIRRFADWWETTPVEKFIEDIDYFLANFAVLNVVGLLANVALILSLVGWFTGREERQEEKHFSTWSIINDGQGDKSGVVKKAVERLHKDGFSLEGLELNETNLIATDLSGANLLRANLSGAELILANLSGAELRFADLSNTELMEINLSGADLRLANLSGVSLTLANLSGADLSGAYLREANFSDADLSRTNLRGAHLFNAIRLSNAQIKLACNWKEAIYVKSTIVQDKVVPEDKQANQERIKEIEQDKDSDPEIPPNCS
ncbi:Uma2 family endonuclease [Dapis sp. BLCC M126]|uniref:Uma2 family endonuclease n=1 Tax=Dapis sp. BLCC M126 TaxID=3400189 RepID=UPI003CF825F2